MHTLPAPPFKGMGKLIHIAAWAILFGLPFFFTGRESQTVTVTANATGMAPGTYDALICVSSNDPDFPRIDLPVTLQVTARPPAIFDDGFEGDDPMCWPTQLFEDPTGITGTAERRARGAGSRGVARHGSPSLIGRVNITIYR